MYTLHSLLYFCSLLVKSCSLVMCCQLAGSRTLGRQCAEILLLVSVMMARCAPPTLGNDVENVPKGNPALQEVLTLCISLPSAYTFFSINFWTRMLANCSHVVQRVFVYTHYVLVIFFSSGTFFCKNDFSPVRCMCTFLRSVSLGESGIFVFPILHF